MASTSRTRIGFRKYAPKLATSDDGVVRLYLSLSCTPMTASLMSGSPRRDTWRQAPFSSYPRGQSRVPAVSGAQSLRVICRLADAQTPKSVLLEGTPAATALLKASLSLSLGSSVSG